jgi:hypothetical protein
MPIEIEDVTADITRATRTETGEVWERPVSIWLSWTYAMPAFALKGDPNTFSAGNRDHSSESILANGWIKYWVVDTDKAGFGGSASATLYKDFQIERIKPMAVEGTPQRQSGGIVNTFR